MSMFRTRYRVVTDRYAGFTAQYRRWWWPFWSECFWVNTHPTLEQAIRMVEKHKRPVVWKEPK